jgi:hypothetical protein
MPSAISTKERKRVKAFVYKTSGICSEGKIMESESLETLCNSLIEFQDFRDFQPELIISKPEMDHPYDEREKQCDWVIEIYDDYRE